jgi:hypothetical protein
MSRAATAQSRSNRPKVQADPEPEAPPRVLSSPEFWDLMQRWQIPDATALKLIEFSGKLGASGKRPRFRFTTRQRRITSYLPEIDAALAAAGTTGFSQEPDVSIAVLKPGGIAVHTTAFNMSSNTHTFESAGLSLYRRRDLEAAIERLESAGHNVEPIDWHQGLWIRG